MTQKLCLKCHEEYINNNQPLYMVFQCSCGHLQTYSGEDIKEGKQITATDIDEMYKKVGEEIQESMCKMLEPLIKKILHIMEKNK